MFYSDEILRKRGKLGLVCKLITEFISGGIVGKGRKKSAVHLSLYLAAQLSYGLVAINRRLAGYLLDDILHIQQRLSSMLRAFYIIDLPPATERDRSRVTMEEPNLAYYDLMGFPSVEPAEPLQIDMEILHVVDSRDITMEEVPIVPELELEFEEEAGVQQDMTDVFLESLEAVVPSGHERSELAPEFPQTVQPADMETPAALPVAEPVRPTKTAPAVSADITVMGETEPERDLPTSRKRLHEEEEFQLEPVSMERRRIKRKRRHLVIDRETKLSDAYMRNRMRDLGMSLTRPKEDYKKRLLPFPDFAAPSLRIHAKKVKDMWSRLKILTESQIKAHKGTFMFDVEDETREEFTLHEESTVGELTCASYMTMDSEERMRAASLQSSLPIYFSGIAAADSLSISAPGPEASVSAVAENIQLMTISEEPAELEVLSPLEQLPEATGGVPELPAWPGNLVSPIRTPPPPSPSSSASGGHQMEVLKSIVRNCKKREYSFFSDLKLETRKEAAKTFMDLLHFHKNRIFHVDQFGEKDLKIFMTKNVMQYVSDESSSDFFESESDSE